MMLRESIKIKQKRKVNYPDNRNNYRRYANAKWNWRDIFLEIDNLISEGVYKHFHYITEKYNIPRATLTRKYKLWQIHGDSFDYNLETRGGNNKSFTEYEEYELYEYIVNVFIKGNLILTNQHIQLLATQKYMYLNKNDINMNIDTSIFSDAWVSKFKQRWKLSSVKTKINKVAVNLNQKELSEYMTNCEYYRNSINRRFIFNLDETFWRILNGTFSVIGIENSNCRKIDTSINPKAGFTTVFVISADGILLKPSIIMRGKTKRSLEKINEISNNDVNKHYSNSGWINVGILKFILNEIVKITNREQSVLILDQYPSHQKEDITTHASQLNITLEYVPVGMTSTRQPLDVNFNGPVKSIGKSLANKIFLKDPYAKYTLLNSIDSMIKASKKIKKETIIESFKIACGI